MEIKGRVVIVTGASGGIGLATAKLLAGKGAKVALVARSKEKLEKLAKELPDSLAITADMSKIGEIEQMIKKVMKHFGRIDILVNNAGQGYLSTVEKTNIGVLRDIFELNVVGPLAAMQAVIPIMKKQQEGVIINISSGTALAWRRRLGGGGSVSSARF